MIPAAALLIGLGCFALVYGLGRRWMTKREMIAAIVDAELGEPQMSPEALAELVERAGLVADRVLSRSAHGERIALMLTRAGWTLRAGEFLALVAVVAVVGALVISLFTSLVIGAFTALWIALLVVTLLGRSGRRRVIRLEEQLPTVLQLLAGSLEAGASVMHAFEVVVEEGDDPIAGELARVVAETKVGRPLLESLEAMASRIGSRDLDWTVEAISIQQQTGGRLADTLRVLAEFMRARIEVRAEVRALSAEARLSGKILTALPLLIGGFFFAFRRAYFEPLVASGMGRTMLISGAIGIAVGSLWMRRLVRVEV
jgi:tight adherence protein B